MKRITITLIVSLILTLSGCLINYLSFIDHRSMPFAIKMHGGEITAMFGFGWRYVRIYAMSMDQTDSIKFSFSIIIFLISFLLVAVIVYIVLKIFKVGK